MFVQATLPEQKQMYEEFYYKHSQWSNFSTKVSDFFLNLVFQAIFTFNYYFNSEKNIIFVLLF